MTSTLAKYAPALIQLAIVLAGAAAQLTGRLTLVDALQLIPLAANVVLVYVVPLFGDAARSGWKTGIAVLGALAAAAIPFAATHHITGPQVAIVILAGLQVLGAHVGVQIRNDVTTAAPVASATSPSPASAPAGEPPTVTTVQRAISSNGGEFLGEAAR